MNINPSDFNQPYIVSIELISKLTTTIASFAILIAFINPLSIPAGQSMKI
jgi:hypothetical protein